MAAIDPGRLGYARERYRKFIDSTADGAENFRLTPRAEASPYSRCFAIFGLHLLGETQRLASLTDTWAAAIRSDLDAARAARTRAGADLAIDKPYLQLLTFSLSALSILDRLRRDPLPGHVLSVLSKDIEGDLARAGALRGVARSGNHAMFIAILLIHARDFLGISDDGRIDRWTRLHVDSMNRFGFWGNSPGMTYLQFQNGYHQYEILEYLGAEPHFWPQAADHVAALADPDGNFAPYPGGGGCYDYDAIFLITGAGDASISRHRQLLIRTANTILDAQNPDGGFCESHYIRPRSLDNLLRIMRHMRMSGKDARYERVRYGLTLLRPRHDRIHTHWSSYSREWHESDLWDSWFRMLTLARIEVALDPAAVRHWRFIDYPGIGYHPTLRRQQAGE